MGGVDGYLTNGQHVYGNVYRAMLLQISRDYNGLPDPRQLKAHEIRFFYDGLRAELKEYQKNG